MAEMTAGEAREIIKELVDSLETCIVLAAAQKAALTVYGDEDWEYHVSQAQMKLSPYYGELFLPLREILAGSSASPSPGTDWHQTVRSLIESVRDVDDPSQ